MSCHYTRDFVITTLPFNPLWYLNGVVCPTFTLNSPLCFFLNTNYDLSTSTCPKIASDISGLELCWHSSSPCNQELFYSTESLWMQLAVWKARKSAAFCTGETIGATQCTMNFASHHCNLGNICRVNGIFHGWHGFFPKRWWWVGGTYTMYSARLLKVNFAFHSHPKAVGTSECFMEVF